MADSTDVTENLSSQLSELEMLVAMYPGQGEMQLGDPALLQDLQEYLDGELSEVPSVEITLNLEVEGPAVVETIVKLPVDYPAASLPQVYLRSDQFSRSEQSRINEDAIKALSKNAIPQEPCILFLLDWVQSHAPDYLTTHTTTTTLQNNMAASKAAVSSGMFSRYWIYSHHIYSKIKRKNMLDMSKEYNLTGFVLPGKPGIICIEGDAKNTADWWAIVRNWQWKRLSLKIQQDEVTDDVDGERKFSGFQEIGEVKGNTRDYHMDMGAFQAYLEKHGFQEIFSEIFSISK